MINVENTDIRRFVHHVVLHPFENILEASKMYFDDTTPRIMPKAIVIPELLSLPLTKRSLVVNIIREKTNFDASPIDERTVHIIRAEGEKLEAVLKKEISVVEAIEESE